MFRTSICTVTAPWDPTLLEFSMTCRSRPESEVVEYVVDVPPDEVEDDAEVDRLDSVVGSVLTFCPFKSVKAKTTVREAVTTTAIIATASILREGPLVAGVNKTEPRDWFGLHSD